MFFPVIRFVHDKQYVVKPTSMLIQETRQNAYIHSIETYCINKQIFKLGTILSCHSTRPALELQYSIKYFLTFLTDDDDASLFISCSASIGCRVAVRWLSGGCPVLSSRQRTDRLSTADRPKTDFFMRHQIVGNFQTPSQLSKSLSDLNRTPSRARTDITRLYQDCKPTACRDGAGQQSCLCVPWA